MKMKNLIGDAALDSLRTSCSNAYSWSNLDKYAVEYAYLL
jgi:hypothetical protein